MVFVRLPYIKYLENTHKAEIATQLNRWIHSVDGFVARQMVQRLAAKGIYIVHIHDDFVHHPNDSIEVFEMYRTILSEIAESDLLASIVSQIAGKKLTITKLSTDLPALILKAQYLLA